MSLAIQLGNTDSVQILIDSGFVIDNSIDWLLHDAAAAAAIDRADLMKVLCLGFREIAVNLADFRGRTTLHVAAIRGHVDSLQFLVSIGGDPDLVDHNGWTPLHCAAAEAHHEAAEFLIDHSTFSKYAVNREGKTSFALAVKKGHSHLYDLLQLGDSLQRAARIDDIHAMKSCLVEGERLNGRDQNEWTPLHRAAFKGRVESVKLLLSHGAQVDVVDDSGYTPLQRAVEGWHLQAVMCLVDHGAKANLKSIKGVDIVGSFNMDDFKNHPSLVAPLCQEKERA